ncbi:MAG: glycosyltransferase family 39 protein, partial [Verrucomicrobiaceae bacterium]
LWIGAAVRASVSAILLGLSIFWNKGKAGAIRLGIDRDGALAAAGPSRGFVIALSIILVAALVMRFPRMTHSLWGDEADAVSIYVQGTYKSVDKNNSQGALEFSPPDWNETFFGAVHGPNNHVLFSVLSRLSLDAWRVVTRQSGDAFTEWVARIPSLAGGLLSIVALALLMRRWGAGWPGLLAVAFMALHPWHVRYSTEARGYGLMLGLFPLWLLALTNALESNRWRHWAAFGALEFLLMYSWAGIFYAVAAVNITALVLMLCHEGRVAFVVRWLTVNLAAAGVFASLYAPLLPQIARARERLLWIKGKPMDEQWLHDILIMPFTGAPFHQIMADNPAEASLQASFASMPLLTVAGCALMALLLIGGIVFFWWSNRRATALLLSVCAAAVACTLHFKFGIKDEMRGWYLIFLLPASSIFLAFGALAITDRLRPAMLRRAAPLLCLGVIGASWWPLDRSLMQLPEEDYLNAVKVTRGRHEVFSPKGTSRVFTCWLWRYSAFYDPRGDHHVRDATALRQRMDETKKAHGELYVIVGYRQWAEVSNADMLRLLEDPTLFEKRETFPARESLHSLDVYRMKNAD